VRQHLASSPDYQVDGRFMGADELRRRLDQRGISVSEFEQDLRGHLMRERLAALVTDGVMVSPREAEDEFRRRSEQVKAEYVMVPADALSVVVTDADVRARFDAGKDRYAFPERRVLSYLLLDLPSLQPRVTVTESEERAYYEAHHDEFKQDEQACASHILVKVKASPEAPEGHADDEAKKIAQSALDQAKAGADFAALAKKYSEDQGSAEKGGDLGCFPRGRMLPEFENAAFALQPGEVSALVKTQYGYHVIRLASKRAEMVPAYAQVKDRIHQTLVGQRVRALLEEQLQGISEALRHGKSLEEVATARGFKVQKSAPVARGASTPPLNSPNLVARAFELKRGETEPEPFPLPTGYAYISLQEVQAPRPADFKEVQDRVRADLQEERAAEAARVKAADLKARAESAGLDKAAPALGLVRKETQGLVARGQALGDLGSSAGLDEAAYTLPEKTLSDPIRVSGGWAVIRVLEKKAYDPAAFEKDKASLIASLRQQRKDELFRSFLQEARKRVTVQRNADAFRRAMAS
jgi:peptidyl-prolyl cis-trans isomerase D